MECIRLRIHRDRPIEEQVIRQDGRRWLTTMPLAAEDKPDAGDLAGVLGSGLSCTAGAPSLKFPKRTMLRACSDAARMLSGGRQSGSKLSLLMPRCPAGLQELHLQHSSSMSSIRPAQPCIGRRTQRPHSHASAASRRRLRRECSARTRLLPGGAARPGRRRWQRLRRRRLRPALPPGPAATEAPPPARRTPPAASLRCSRALHSCASTASTWNRQAAAAREISGPS